MTDTPMTPDVAAVQQAATRAIHALKSPTPDGSPYYQSGWDDGLEAAIDAARDALEAPARDLLAEVDRLRLRVDEVERAYIFDTAALKKRVAKLAALKPAQFQECQVCGAGYEYGEPCSACEFNKQMTTATADPAYRSQPLPPRDAMCTCGHTGLDHHHSETKCWATLPRTQQRNGTWSAVPTCDCSEFEAAP
ncbi:hypothetical protein [Streptomyces microflavus]|uniref:hypothetical protein n=1 Tax=Streptomyces microflavus TaxID=1919 RepID=UPI002E334364|nr:hypothetical protein [Streptomyces microflavus]